MTVLPFSKSSIWKTNNNTKNIDAFNIICEFKSVQRRFPDDKKRKVVFEPGTDHSGYSDREGNSETDPTNPMTHIR